MNQVMQLYIHRSASPSGPTHSSTYERGLPRNVCRDVDGPSLLVNHIEIAGAGKEVRPLLN